MPYVQKTYKSKEVCSLFYFSKLKDALSFGESWSKINLTNNPIGQQNRSFIIKQ